MTTPEVGMEYQIRRYPDWQCRYEVVTSYGGFVGLTFTLWGAKRLIRKERRRRAMKRSEPIYREPA